MAEGPRTNLRNNEIKSTVFLGGGHITSALTAGLRLAGSKASIAVYDRNPEKLRALRRESGVEIARELKGAVEQAAMLVIAVRPGSVREMLDEVAACGAQAPRLCVSLAAGVPLRNLRAWLGPPVHWARAMPSPVCRIGKGLTPVCFDRGVAKAERVRVQQFFGHVGPLLNLPEGQFDAITATHSPTHGYHALATLAKAAQDAGLDRKTALTAAAHALSDGILYWRESGNELADLLHEAATPGGIAAATMSAMDASGYARVVKNGIRAGIRQARRNAKR
jgi:pyrroline-5-carboxylate reductase